MPAGYKCSGPECDAHVIMSEHLTDDTFLEERVSDFPQFCDFIKEFSPQHVEAICGVKADLIYQAARFYATAKPAICFHGLVVTEHVQGFPGGSGHLSK
jgi:formate dehydrogenase major subunit